MVFLWDLPATVGGGGGMMGGNNFGTPEASGQADSSGTGENVAA